MRFLKKSWSQAPSVQARSLLPEIRLAISAIAEASSCFHEAQGTCLGSVARPNRLFGRSDFGDLGEKETLFGPVQSNSVGLSTIEMTSQPPVYSVRNRKLSAGQNQSKNSCPCRIEGSCDFACRSPPGPMSS